MGRKKIGGRMISHGVRFLWFAAAISALALAGCSTSGRVIHVGSKNFTEQVVLGEIIAQHLEHRSFKIARDLNLGGTLLAHQALITGQIDLYPEYSGTALTAILKDPIQTDSATVLTRVRTEYEDRFHLTWLDSLGINNGFAMVVARANPAQTLTDAARAQSPWDLGVGYEFEQRADGLIALQKTYGLRTAAIRTMDLGLLYKALEGGQVGMIAANATDGLLSISNGPKVLADDRHAFPPYEIGIAVRDAALGANPGLRDALAELSGRFTNQTMQKLNYQVDGEHRAVAQVAAEFLKQAGL